MLSNSLKVAQILRALWLLFAVLTLNKSLVAAFFEACDDKIILYPGHTDAFQSYNYPNGYYQPRSSCRSQYTTLENHYVVADCTINLPRDARGCTTESFYVAENGDRNLVGSERLCGADSFQRRSKTNSLVLAYISQGSYGQFKCNVYVKEKECQCGWGITKNIANGQEAGINEYSSMVALKTRGQNSKLFCSAVMVTNRFLVTAAHCALYHHLSNVVAWVGSHNIESARDTIYARAYYLSNYIVHEGYVPETLANDIALLVTSENIQFSRGVGPICMPPYSNVNNAFAWEDVDIIGWGSTNFYGGTSATLQKITVTTTTYEACKDMYKNIDNIYETQICTRDLSNGRRDSCQYDSGGPVIYRYLGRQYLVGIVSYGKECATDSNPTGVNTRMTSYLRWIYQKTSGLTCTMGF